MDNTNEDTSNFLNWVEIKNFKSIKDLRLDCKRVNIFIGKPNVGKSNILEGLGMLGASYNNDKYLKGAIRYETLIDLYYDHDSSLQIEVNTNTVNTAITKNLPLTATEIAFDLKWHKKGTYARNITLSGQGKWLGTWQGVLAADQDIQYEMSPTKKYDFLHIEQFNNSFNGYLLPPHGWNLYEVVYRNTGLSDEFARLFQEQNLDFILIDKDRSFVLQKKQGIRAIQYPFFSIADTFRRFMFYIAAIESNKNSVIVFEEPEVHSFPPYTQELAYRMIYDESNQYFISTHSPYMLHPFIEKMDYKDLNVFITYYQDYQTHVRALTEEELTDILDFSTNVFFNLNKFEPNA